jgi:membrane-bound lytic murein transglycosylase D
MATIIERYRSRSFGFASKNFYCEFLAALEVEENAERYFGRLARDAPENPEVVVLDAYYRPHALAAAFGLSPDALRTANPALLDGVWKGQRYVPKGYALRLPRNPLRAAPDVVLASIPAAERHVEQVRERQYRVRRGDTLSRIAARFGVRTSDLMAANGLKSAHRIRVGQVLEIPGSPRIVASAPRSPAAAAPSAAGPATASYGDTYRVRRGDTLTRIAKRYGVSQHELAAQNGLSDPSRLRVGQVLQVPGGAAPARPAGNVYTVQRGDTLDSIGRRFGVSANRIRAGQRLYLPEP